MLRLSFLFLSILLTVSLFAREVDWTAYADRATIQSDDPAELAARVTDGLAGEGEKAAALFYWVTHNVAYDVRQMEQIVADRAANRRRSYTASEYKNLLRKRLLTTLKKGKGVCDNYARLYRALCEAAGLEAVFVPGNARANLMMPGSLGIGHAWNAVRVDGEWWLVDCTWGAGLVNDKGKFEYRFRPAYFAPDPASMSYSHFPREAKWQLLEEPVDQEAFLARPAVRTGFLRYGLHDLSQPTYEIYARRGKDLELRFRTTIDPGPLFCANFTLRKQIDCAIEREGDEVTVVVPAAQSRNMVFSVLTQAEGDPLFSHRLRVK